MSDNSIIGPYDRLPTDGGQAAPLYLITFDKRGRCQSPLTLARLLDDVKNGGYTDVHVFSHGWNNVFKDAVRLYRDFFAHYFHLRSKHVLNGTGYSPIVVGIIWPSTLLVLPWEATPRIAGTGSGPERDELQGADDQVLREVADALAPADAERLYHFCERGPTLTPTEAREFATLLLPIYQGATGAGQTSEVGQDAPSIGVDDLMAIWQKTLPRKSRPSAPAGFARETGAAAEQQPSVAGGSLEWLDPRLPIRIASVLQMKDRAGTVGATGVGPELVQKLLAAENVRTHLIGHSYGAKVILSSLCCGTPPPAASLLLLEPAISYLSFAENIDGSGRQGGYRQALDYVKQPILSTFSRSDAPLTKFFHLAVVRDSDWGEQKIAGVPPSKFAALGGYGPGGLKMGESKTLEVLPPEIGSAATKYPRGEAGIKIYGLDGSNGQIGGHGDVTTDFTAWAHLSLVSGGNLR